METLDETQASVDSAIGAMIADTVETLATWDDAGVCSHNLDGKTGEVERIEHRSRSGFIPHTNGGWHGVACVSFNQGRFGGWKCMESTYERDYRDMAESFLREHGDGAEHDDSVAAFEAIMDAEDRKAEDPLLPGMPREYAENMPAHEWREGWEMEGDDCTFFLVVRAIYYLPSNHRCETGEHEVYFFAGVDLDFDYCRDSIAWAGGDQYAKPTFDLTIPLAQVTPEKLAEVKESILELFSKA